MAPPARPRMAGDGQTVGRRTVGMRRLTPRPAHPMPWSRLLRVQAAGCCTVGTRHPTQLPTPVFAQRQPLAPRVQAAGPRTRRRPPACPERSPPRRGGQTSAACRRTLQITIGQPMRRRAQAGPPAGRTLGRRADRRHVRQQTPRQHSGRPRGRRPTTGRRADRRHARQRRVRQHSGRPRRHRPTTLTSCEHVRPSEARRRAGSQNEAGQTAADRSPRSLTPTRRPGGRSRIGPVAGRRHRLTLAALN
jgi:hypothetical protein